jgi:hypothetical protein
MGAVAKSTAGDIASPMLLPLEGLVDCGAKLVSPKPLESIRCEFRVPNRVRDVLVSEVVL